MTIRQPVAPKFHLPALAGLLFFLVGCGLCPSYVRDVAKSDVDLIAESHFREVDSLLRSLTIKLYRRNPRELRKVPGETVRSRLHQLFGDPPMPRFAELQGRVGPAAINLCFDPGFAGDRVFALVTGLRGMMLAAYGNRTEQYFFDRLDAQHLYNSARNVEIVVWRLSQRRDRDGNLFLLTNSRRGEAANLSFERLFGKIIALQDMMASITADQGQRTINKAVRSLASAALFPVGI